MYAARLTIATLAFAAATPAFASTLVNHPGANCVQDSGGTLDIDSYARAENDSSTSDMYVVCPIALTDVNNVSTGADIWAIDMNYTYDLWCEARRSNPIGGTVASSRSYTSGTSASYQTMSPTPPSTNGNYDARWYYCWVPRTYSGSVSEIISYRH